MLLSVIIPAHNEEDLLPECIESVVAATKNIECELLLIDDGSGDGSRAVAEGLAKTYPQIQILSHPHGANRGVGASRNLGIRAAKGRYISFIDADDIMQEHRYDKALKILAESDVDGVLDAVGLMFEKKSDAIRWGATKTFFSNDCSIPQDNFLHAALYGGCAVLTPSLTVRRDLFGKCGLYSAKLRLSEDYHLWLRMAACGRFLVGENDRPVVLYRRHAGNTWVPHQYDSFRDLKVVGEVIAWAKRTPWVAPEKVGALEMHFTNKLFHCFEMAQIQRKIGKGLKTALVAARYETRALLGKRYWANLFRLFFPKKVVF